MAVPRKREKTEFPRCHGRRGTGSGGLPRRVHCLWDGIGAVSPNRAHLCQERMLHAGQ